jgi:O-antigen/teichoic acid export membrane protein
MIFKNKKRLTLFLSGSAFNFAAPLFNLIISFLVIRYYSIELWGKYVQIAIAVNLINAVAAWGNKQYLLKQFSLKQTEISQQWLNSFISRSLMLLIFLPVSYLLADSFYNRVIILCWIILSFLLKSFDAVIIYYRSFIFSFISEIFSFLIFLVLFILYLNELTLAGMILILTVPIFLKTILHGFYFGRKLFVRSKWKISLKFFKNSFDFFVLEFTGMLGSRIDLYIVALFLSAEQLGIYQILINMVLYFQAFSGLIIQPYIKNLYRANISTILRFMNKFFVWGAGVSVFATITILLVGNYIYSFNLDIVIYLLCGLLILPVYIYTIVVYLLLKFDNSKRVVIFTAVGIIINIVLNIYLIKIWGIKGALLASTITQWIILILYVKEKTKIKISKLG